MDGEDLRSRARLALKEGRLTARPVVEHEMRELIEELFIHQAELDIQNEELRGAQLELEKSRQRYMTLFSTIPVACFVVDLAGFVQDVNRMAIRQFRSVQHRLVGQPLLLLAASKDHMRLLAHVAAARRGEPVETAEYLFYRLDGTVFTGLFDCASFDDSGSVVCSVVDISDRKHAMEAMTEAKAQMEQALNAKTRFLATASHDLRQPVHALTLFMEALEQREPGQDITPIVERLRQATDSLRSLLDGLLDLSRVEGGLITPELSLFSSADIMHRLELEFSAIAQQKGLRFKTFAPDVELWCDPQLVERILRNILSNAIRYTDQGGVLFGARRRGGRLRFEIWDSGIGIPEDQLDVIFEDFHQVGNSGRNREGGLGLGLSIVSRLAAMTGCRVSVKSQLRKGSCFSVEVPLRTESLA
ncbi:HAMP domain-containing sensor histidine kinase [Telmatospirillum sp. J64-1]|uniref:sensor histidine kinase n=1 Tax=Telmatospirillum sp. J64-1 TaxID=2502183 RepID=UPI00115EF67C|nr:PAS domain-containing sensor histidine kinase [Telmatospirillum sp. J64-1]